MQTYDHGFSSMNLKNSEARAGSSIFTRNLIINKKSFDPIKSEIK